MIAEIISVGTELLLGQIVNTNAAFIARELAAVGINAYHQSVVGDNRQKLIDVIKIAEERSDLLIFTGGLGPTQDDITKETIASYLNEPLALDSDGLAHIRNYFEKTGREMTANNEKQAVYFKNGLAFKNMNGHALGSYIKKEETAYVVLPGPPNELKEMVQSELMPFLLAEINSDRHYILSKTLCFYGIGESTLASRLAPLIDGQTNPTLAPYAGSHEVSLRITASGKDADDCNQLLEQMVKDVLVSVGDYYYGEGEQNSLANVVGQLLTSKGMSISAAESLTGGLFQSTLVSIPKSSQFFKGGMVAYDEAIKRNGLGISQQLLDEQGTVSEACAIAMSEACRQFFQTDIAISFTGVAGPDDLENQPAGTVWIGISQAGKEPFAKQYRFMKDRNGNRQHAVMQGLDVIRRLVAE